MVLTLLVGADGSVSRERAVDWATELFNVASLTGLPASTQEGALIALARLDTDRAVQLFRRQVLPPEGASEDARTYAALALFPSLWARDGKDSILTIEDLAAWLGSTGEYPYRAVGTVIPELAKVDQLLGRKLFFEAIRYFGIERKFPGSNRAYVDFLVSVSGMPHDEVFRSAVAKAVEAIEKSNPPPGQKAIQMEVRTAKGTEVFFSEREYLLYKLLPLIQELDAKWYERVVESKPALRGRSAPSGNNSTQFENGAILRADEPALSPMRVREALDSGLIARAVEVSRTDPKAAFSIASAILTPHMRDIALASILPRYSDVDRDQSAGTLKELQKRADSMQASPAKLALEVKLTDALFALNLESEAIALSQKAMDLGLEMFSLDRISHPGKLPFGTQGFDSLLDLAGILGRRLGSAEAEQQIRQVRVDALKACMLAVFARGLGDAEQVRRVDAPSAE